MDSCKIPEGNDECSSNESGWTTYIASPDHDYDDNGDEEDRTANEREDVDSDDSMASDASSGPSYKYEHVNRNPGHAAAGNKNERKQHAGKKEQQKEEKKQCDEKTKAAQDKADCAKIKKKVTMFV